MSTYCTRSNVEDTYGVDNVIRWAKLQDDYGDAEILARITRGILVCSEEIDDVLRFAGFEIPCVDPDGNTPTSIEQLCADLVGVWLYESRGVDDVDAAGNPRHKLTHKATQARAVLQDIAERRRKINVYTNTG